MTRVRRFWPLLTGTHRYDKSLSTRDCGHGTLIEAPILAYLIETVNGCILYDVGCDYEKIADAAKCSQYFENETFPFGPRHMTEEQRLTHRFAALGLQSVDVDLVFIDHLHFDHGGGLRDMAHAEIHVHVDEWHAARAGADEAYFADDFAGDYRWRLIGREYDLVPGVRAIESPGHTAGHMSLYVELLKGAPIVITGDAADLTENLEQEIAPGLCWCNGENLALASIPKLKNLARETSAELSPNHNMAFYRGCLSFPVHYE